MISCYTIRCSKDALEGAFSARFADDDFRPTFRASPHMLLPAILPEEPARVRLFRWGVMSSFSAGKTPGERTINTSFESMLSSTAGTRGIFSRRCALPADGFYHRRFVTRKKYGYYYTCKEDASPFLMGGIWEKDEGIDSSPGSCFRLLTTSRIDPIGSLSTSMPLVLTREAGNIWLSATTNIDDLRDISQWVKSLKLSSYPVSPKVATSTADDETLIEKSPMMVDQHGRYTPLDFKIY